MNTMAERDRLLRKISSAQFAAWELHIFLDTHPNDCEALRSYQKYCETAAALTQEFERTYGPLRAQAAVGKERWKWVNDPWPWENDRGARCDV